MRFVAVIAVIALLPVPFASAGNLDEKIPDAQQLAALEVRAAEASPREQCYLYAELVHSMTEIATIQLQQGQGAQASASLESARSYAAKLQTGLVNNARKLKNAEILIRHTAFRLKELMMGASLDDRPTMEATLQQLNTVEARMMMQVFQK
ncbi:hypothetical protein [Paracidobacterium acidisoli]|uniref:Uncharacterized protein n=1 Tax=Paracidobacterium acidisoli TaxID=2303751 RepID=A0A372IKH0_9BACT|nr:hypothetical protein [Paracidobacterium acidisoli]MBT9332733.1 hypothetical protein [Paracidobacterium acidisoli]